MLFSIDELKSDFVNYEIIELAEKEIELNEGLFHNGKGSVIRFVGRKNKLPATRHCRTAATGYHHSIFHY